MRGYSLTLAWGKGITVPNAATLNWIQRERGFRTSLICLDSEGSVIWDGVNDSITLDPDGVQAGAKATVRSHCMLSNPLALSLASPSLH